MKKKFINEYNKYINERIEKFFNDKEDCDSDDE